ncbi:unnamed protein product [Cochlearia groenlandica]
MCLEDAQGTNHGLRFFDTKTRTWTLLSDPGPEIRSVSIYHAVSEIQRKDSLLELEQKTYAYDTNEDSWESCERSIAFPRSQCVMDNVWFRYGVGTGLRQTTSVIGQQVDIGKRLESLGEKYKRNGGSSSNTTKLGSCGGKLLLLWEGYMKHNPTSPVSCDLLHCLVVSV